MTPIFLDTGYVIALEATQPIPLQGGILKDTSVQQA
jgi:hypothetical protein